jgi:GNAT superfamily N-acetyltransferase
VGALIDVYGASADAVPEHRSAVTPLGQAAYGGHVEAAEALLSRGAAPSARNKWAETALEVAERAAGAGVRGAGEVAALLRAAAPLERPGERPGDEGGGEAAARAAAGAPVPLPCLRRGLTATVRAATEADTEGIRALYARVQGGHAAGDPLGARVHAEWGARVLSRDLLRPAAFYGSGRRMLWVAEAPPGAVAAVEAREGAAREAAAGGEEGALPPALPPAEDLIPLPSGGALVGMVALAPWAPDAEEEGGGGEEGAAGALPAVLAREGPRGAVGEVLRMATEPRARRCGVGAALLAHLEVGAARFGYAALALTTLAQFSAAVALYEAGGYVPVGPPVRAAFAGQNIVKRAFGKLLPPSDAGAGVGAGAGWLGAQAEAAAAEVADDDL